jgi:hypothetical protein
VSTVRVSSFENILQPLRIPCCVKCIFLSQLTIGTRYEMPGVARGGSLLNMSPNSLFHHHHSVSGIIMVRIIYINNIEFMR